MRGGQFITIEDPPIGRASSLPLSTIPRRYAVLDAEVGKRHSGSRRGDLGARAGRQQTGDQQAV
jgi:hypothetical protein